MAELNASAGVKFEWVEAARGIAAIAVVLMHAANLMNVPHFSGHIGLGGIFNFGYVGVDFFFVLSGFVIAYAHRADIGRPDRLPTYLWRRFSRIYPIFWFSLALALSVVLMGRFVLGKAEPIEFGLIDFVATVMLVNIAEPKYLGVAWSLQYEVMFYVLFAAALIRRELGLMLLAVWAAACALRILGVIDTPLLGLLSGHTFQFVLGTVTALGVHKLSCPRYPLRLVSLALFLLVAAIILERNVVPAHGELGRVLLGFASAALIYGLVALDRTRLNCPPKMLSTLGSVSYSVYLMHIIFISVTYSLLRVSGLYAALPEIVVFLVAVAVAIGASVTLGLLVELPLVRWLKKIVPPRPLNRAGSYN